MKHYHLKTTDQLSTLLTVKCSKITIKTGIFKAKKSKVSYLRHIIPGMNHSKQTGITLSSFDVVNTIICAICLEKIFNII